MIHVLLIGGSDSSGGAGIARDLRTLCDLDLNLVGVPVITAVTAQTDASVQTVHLVPPDVVEDQISTALASNTIRAIKIGMLGTRAIVEAVARSLPSRDDIPIVLDPVLAASSGRALLDEDGRLALIEQLFPRVTLVTPNLPESAALLGELTCDGEYARRLDFGRRLLALGPQAVLVKGGHANGAEAVDLLISTTGGVVTLSEPRLKGTVRGTGCALSSAIAAGLAQGELLVDACREAKRYLTSRWAPAPADSARGFHARIAG
jgi:hydroxymethylpyrimidine/phosphomethylpyrimidine kinase